MAEKDTIIKEKVKYTGYGDFKDIYNFAYGWFKGEGFSVVEELYNEKVKGESKDIEMVWATSKKLTDYFKAEVGLKWRILGMSDVEVEVDGKKKKMNKFNEIGIEIKGVLVRDYDSKWNKNVTSKFFKEVYNKYVIPARNKEMEGKIEGFVQDFKEEIKALLELTGRK